MLTTQFSFSQTYGYFEIDAKLPTGQGLWPAFWMLPTNQTWRPEIDIFEVLGSNTTSLWQFSHPADTTYDRYFNTTVADMSTAFHRYGMDWQPDNITFYFDGHVTGVAPTPPEMNGPMYLLLDLAVGGSWGGPPASTTQFPASLQVDYIRAYQSKTPVNFTGLALSPTSQSATEGNSGVTVFIYNVVRTGDLSAASSVDWSVTGSGANPTNAADFAGGVLPHGTLNFAAGQNTAAIAVNVAGETTIEPDEGFTVTLSNATGATIAGAAATGLVINDDSPPPASLAISPATVSLNEGNSGVTYFVYTVTRSGNIAGPSIVNYSVAGSGANPANATDFNGAVLSSGQVFFGGGETTKNIWIPVAGDTTSETDETFTVTLSNPSSASISTATAQGVIVNDDGAVSPPPPAPSLAIGPATVSQAEGNSGVTPFNFTVTRSGDLSAASSASWAVTGSGANPTTASDFSGAVLPSGSVSFAAGQSTATVTVNVAGDATVEPNEGFTLTLSNASGASISAAAAQGVIVNDDAASQPAGTQLNLSPPTISLSEGGPGAITYFVYTVTRTGPVSGPSTAMFSVTGSGANPAVASDFQGGAFPSGQIFFGGGETSKTIWAPVAGDATAEPDEGFTLALSSPTGASLGAATATGVILNDDGVPPPTSPPPPPPPATMPSISVSPTLLGHSEGNSGLTPYVFTLTRSGDLTGSSMVNWSVAGSGSAPADASDFQNVVLPAGQTTFAAGASTTSVTVNVAGDTVYEPDQSFSFTLSTPTGAVLGTSSATGVIVNDDPAPAGTSVSLSPSNISHPEGNAGDTYFVYTVTRTGDLSGPSVADYSVTGSGTNPATASDFDGGLYPSGKVYFGGGEASKSIWIPVLGNTNPEPNETFTLTLFGATGAAIGAATATGVIQDDDGWIVA